MSDLESYLQRVQEKLQVLLKAYAALKKEKKALQQELETARQRVDRQQQETDALRQQIEVLKLAAGEMNASEKKEFEKRINGYIREIDRCIALLSE